jgi:succinate-semialdehyde dehydrogenase/glutarate-semialdehyde dehydrogenase
VGSRSIRPVRPLCDPRNCRPAGDCRDWREAIAAADLRRALAAADRAFKTWRKVSAYDRGKVLRKAGDLLRSRAEAIAPVMTREQGKPRAEARGEVASGADILDWFAEEARRTYGRVIPARSDTVQQIVTKEPSGRSRPSHLRICRSTRPPARWRRRWRPAARSFSRARRRRRQAAPRWCRRAGGCGPAGGLLNLVFGVPADISSYLIPHRTIRKVSFTDSVPVAKRLAMLARAHMKRVTMELGGHAPAIVFADADLVAAKILSANKYRNAGQTLAIFRIRHRDEGTDHRGGRSHDSDS